MIKIKLNKSEIQTLISLLINAEYSSIEDGDVRELTIDKIRGILRRLNSRFFLNEKKESLFTFKPAEMAALHQTFKTYLPLRMDIYEGNLVLKINMLIEQKAA